METSRIDHQGAGRAEAADSAIDPRMVEMLRSALIVIAHEQAPPAAGPIEVKKLEPIKDDKKKAEDQIPLFWKLCSAALLSVAALVAVTLYNQLSAGSSQLRSELGLLRHEVGQLRNDLVPKDDYAARNERTINTIKQVQAQNKAALETWRERLGEQRTAVTELRLQIKEAERELQRLRERLSALEREASPPTTGVPAKGKGR
jgi:hypothetical protein